MTLRSRIVVSCGLVLFAVGGQPAPAAEGRRPPLAQQPITPQTDRQAIMQQHFGSVMRVYEAVTRGDLPTARASARAILDRPDPPNLPAGAAPYLQSLKSAASRVAEGATVPETAAAAAAMLATCGDCHRAVGTMPAHAAPTEPAVGGVIGHMQAHKAAVDLMAQGLTIPSTTTWNAGADALATAPLRRGQMPADPKLSGEVMASEKAVHALAGRAHQAADQASRAAVYGEIIQSCATCHSLHGNVWGPEKQ